MGSIPTTDQYTSAVTIGELFRGAFRSPHQERHLRNISRLVIPALTILDYDEHIARIYGKLAAELETAGQRLADADLQIAATAVHHDLELVTGNVKHFDRVPGLKIHRVLADNR